MGKIIKLKRGLKQNLIPLAQGEPGYVTDENELYIGTPTGNSKISRNKEVSDINLELIDINSSVSQINSDINDIDSKVTQIESDITGIDTSITNINSYLSQNTNNLTNVNSELDGIDSQLLSINTSLTNLMPVGGSNANGRYVKFPDGTMICTIKKTVETYGTGGLFDVTFPATFINNDVKASFVHTSTDKLFYFVQDIVNTTTLNLYGLARPFTGGGLASGTIIPLSIIVIGRWKV